MWMCKTTDSSSVCQRRKHETAPQFVYDVYVWSHRYPLEVEHPWVWETFLHLSLNLFCFMCFIRLWAHEWRRVAWLIQKWRPGAGRNVIFVRAVNSSEDRTHGVRCIACEFSLIPVCALGCTQSDILNIESTHPETVRVLYEWTNSSGSGSHKQFWLIGWSKYLQFLWNIM